MEPKEKLFDFFLRMDKEGIEKKDAMKIRVKQLFEEFVMVGGPEKDAAFDQLLALFDCGYRLGVADYAQASEKWKELEEHIHLEKRNKKKPYEPTRGC